MGVTVGAALKKAATILLSDPKVLKKVATAILVVLVALILPLVMVVCLFSGEFRIDTGQLLEYVQSNLTQEDIQLLQRIESTMTEIETAMVEANFSGSVGAAQALYILALSDHAGQPGFVSRLVSCFAAEQTDDQLIANVNSTFGTNISVQDFSNVMRNVRSKRIDSAHYVDCGTKNNLDLVQWAISAYNAKWGYVMGTFGQVLTRDLLAAKLQQLPDAIGPMRIISGRITWVCGRQTALGLLKATAGMTQIPEVLTMAPTGCRTSVPTRSMPRPRKRAVWPPCRRFPV